MAQRDRDWDEYEDEDEDDYERRPRRRRRPPKKSHGWLIGLLIGLGVLVVLVFVGVFLAVRSLFGPTSFPAQSEDYAEARSKFQTRLIRQGPAPQAWEQEFPPPGVVEIEYLSGGLRLKAWVDDVPAGVPAKPAVLFLHGGFAFGEDDWEQARPFRDAGFITMLPKLRGENGLPGYYSMFYNEVDDILAAAEVLSKRPGVDPNHLYVAGHSVGGSMAMLAAMTSNKFRAAASFSGSPDQVSWARGQPEIIPFDSSNQREFQMRSPLAFAASFKCPTRIYYGSQEFYFKSACDKTAELAKRAGRDVEAVSIQGDHMTMVPQAMRQAIAFFQQK
jgi:dienelactone hydrolase